MIRSTASEAAEVSVETLVRHGPSPSEARDAATDSPFVGSPDQVATEFVRYAGARAEEVVFDWPMSIDTGTLDALAVLRRELG